MATADEVLAQMDECGTELSIIFGFAFKDLGLCREVNDYVLQVCARQPRSTGRSGVCTPGVLGSAAANWSVAWTPACAGVESWRRHQAGRQEFSDLVPDSGLPARTGPSPGGTRERAGRSRIPGQGTASPPRHASPWRKPTRVLDLVLSHLGGGVFMYELMPEVRAHAHARVLRHGGHTLSVRAQCLPGRRPGSRPREADLRQRLPAGASDQVCRRDSSCSYPSIKRRSAPETRGGSSTYEE